VTNRTVAPLTRELAIADVCEALTADQPYRPAMAWDQVLGILRKEAGKGLCAESVDAVAASRG
jgi:HD-GYP domain-containing protein (c-di-GMP phosphodiesterase class II)